MATWVVALFETYFYPFLGAAATLIGIIAVVPNVDQRLPPERRKWLAEFIRPRRSPSRSPTAAPAAPRTVAQFLRSSVNLFDIIFGPRHWSIRCFVSAVAASFTFSLL